MTQAVEHNEAEAHNAVHAEDGHDGGHAHPSEAVYIKVAIFLAVMTAIEVGLSYASVGPYIATVFLLLGLAVVKFFTVAMYFMHLKFDNPVLRRLFITGIVLACFCYIAYLSTLHVFLK